MQSIMFSFDAQIQSGIFLNDLFVFTTITGIYVLENYNDLIKISSDYPGVYNMKSACSDYLIFRLNYKKIDSTNMITGKKYFGDRLRNLNNGSLKFSKEFLIISYFDYWSKIYY